MSCDVPSAGRDDGADEAEPGPILKPFVNAAGKEARREQKAENARDDGKPICCQDERSERNSGHFRNSGPSPPTWTGVRPSPHQRGGFLRLPGRGDRKISSSVDRRRGAAALARCSLYAE